MERIFKSEIREDREIFIDVITNFSKQDFLILSEENKVLKAKIDIKKFSSLKERERFANEIIDQVMANQKLKEEIVFIWKNRLASKKINSLTKKCGENPLEVKKYLGMFLPIEIVTNLWLSKNSGEHIYGDSLYENIMMQVKEGEKKMENKVEKDNEILNLSLTEIIEKYTEGKKELELKEEKIKILEEKINKLENNKEFKILKKELNNLNIKIDDVLVNNKKIDEIKQRVHESTKIESGIKTNTNDILRETKKITVNKIVKEISEKQANDNKEIVKIINKALGDVDKRIEEKVESVIGKTVGEFQKELENKLKEFANSFELKNDKKVGKNKKEMVTDEQIDKLFE
ncbi:MAG: hypothetical protein ACRC30_05365 [Clostridium sp.]